MWVLLSILVPYLAKKAKKIAANKESDFWKTA